MTNNCKRLTIYVSERTQKSISASPDSARHSSDATNAEAASQLASLRIKVTAQTSEMSELKAQLESARAELEQQVRSKTWSDPVSSYVSV